MIRTGTKCLRGYLTEQLSSSSIQFDVALISSSAARRSPPSPRALVPSRAPSSRARLEAPPPQPPLILGTSRGAPPPYYRPRFLLRRPLRASSISGDRCERLRSPAPLRELLLRRRRKLLLSAAAASLISAATVLRIV